MKRILVAIGIVIFALTAETVRAEQKNSSYEPEYTSSQINKIAREAHTVAQYTVLADYYSVTQRIYKRKAAEEMHLWALRSEMTNPLREKWPRPVDSARNLFEYYEYRMAQSAALFAKYDRLADAAATK